MDVCSSFLNSSSRAASDAARFEEPRRRAARDTDRQKRVVVEIVKISTAAQPPAKFAAFGSTEAVRRLPGQSQLLARLRNKFTDDELVAAAAAVRAATGDLIISPVLDTPSSCFFLADESGEPVDIVSRRGSLSNEMHWQKLVPATTNGIPPYQVPVVLCSTDAELFAFARFDIKCLPTGSFALARGRELVASRSKYRQLREFEFVVPACRIESLLIDPSPSRIATVRRIAAIDPGTGVAGGALFSIWLPSAGEIREFRRAHHARDEAALRGAFEASLKKSRFPPTHAVRLLEQRRPCGSWADARVELDRVLDRAMFAPPVDDVEIALKKLEQAFYKQVLQPLELTPAKGPEALHGFASAELARTWFNELGIVVAARRVIEGHFPGLQKRLDDAALERHCKIARSVADLMRSVKNK